MALQIASINSGSNGNCYYVGNQTDAVLIDVGISCRETEIRMKQIGLDIKKVKAVFVSHEHTDHIKGVATLAHKYHIPIYITSATAKGLKMIKHLAKSFTQHTAINVGELLVIPFFKQHDAADPHSFIVTHNNITVGVFTDIGTVCENLISYFNKCDAAFLEANYDDEMLDNGAYPQHLKNRIKGSHGHLSNKQALDLFIKHRSANLSHLVLSHLSKDNNSPLLAKSLFELYANETKIIVADRYSASELYTITNENSSIIAKPAKAKQLLLF
jgi:phosphoribosyl 1,2-cyclic phosphodiesterase